MPIPPRAIPTPAPRRAQTQSQARPGSSLPRRGLTFFDNADLYDLPLPSSVPVKGLSGITMVKEKPKEVVKEGWKNEVGIGELVMDGLGRREKRATTATSLGFDFIPNPTIVALPDQASTSTSTSTSHSAAIPFKNRCKLVTSSSSPSTSSPLANTPSTPALVPTQDQEIDDEDDDWEHVTDFAESKRELEHDDGDIIFLGELELEDLVEAASVVNKGGKARRGKEKTYAAVVGAIATA